MSTALDGGMRVEERLERSLGEVSGGDSLTRNVLSMIVHQNYEHAEKEIEIYINLKKEFPKFASVVERYVDHCNDLMHAIRTKRSMPGLESFSMSKRQEIYDAVLRHFDDLKETLKRIEKTEYSFRIADLRSTTIVVKTFSWCVFAVLILALVLDVYHGLYSTSNAVFESTINELIDVTFGAFSL